MRSPAILAQPPLTLTEPTSHLAPRSRHSLLTAGLAVAAMIVPLGTTQDADAEPLASGNTPVANIATNQECGPDNNPVCDWKVIAVERVPGYRRHAWKNCVRFAKSRLQQTVTCSLSKSDSVTTTAEVGGNVEVGFATLSEKVGYSVNKTTTITTSEAVTVPPNAGSGHIQWAAVFGNRRKVTQENQVCIAQSPGYYKCYHAENPDPNNIRYAFTEQFDSPIFRARIKKTK